MAKQGSTKDKILKLISEGDNNLSAISERLDLAPSTVSKHLQDLEISGAIVQKDNPHIKKWKYYQLNSGATADKTRNERFAVNGNFMKAAAFVVILAFIAGAAFFYLQGVSKAVYIPVSLTDPPQVPAGTQALYINYSSLSVHLAHGGSSAWIPVNATGRLDLMSLINVSQVLGRVEIKSNSTFDMVRFNITSSSITVDNITYSVQVMNGPVVAKVASKLVNKSSNILLDFSPIVVPMYSQDSTSFMLLPSLKAAVVPNPASGKPVSPRDRYPVQQYNKMFKDENVNLTIADAMLHSYDNYTSLNMDLLNNGKNNVLVMAVMLYGNETPSEMPNAVIINGTAIVNASDIRSEQPGQQGIPQANGSMPMADWHAGARPFDRNDSDFSINESAIREAGAYLGVKAVLIRMPGRSSNILIHDIDSFFGSHAFSEGAYAISNWTNPMRQPGIDFLVGSNGTLFMPLPQLMLAPAQKPGYLLMPKSSITISYNGAIRMIDGGIHMTLPGGSSYKVLVVTNAGIAQANLTST
jgi:DNA-binding transcriptional ArsR family regulator